MRAQRQAAGLGALIGYFWVWNWVGNQSNLEFG